MAITLLDAVARLRVRIKDTGGDLPAAPAGYSYYWESDDSTCLLKNDALAGIIDESQKEFCRRSPLSDALTVYVSSGVSTYSLDPCVLAVERAHMTTLDRDLVRVYQHRIDESDERFVFDGEARYFRTDLSDHEITLVGAPSVDDTLVLAVRRLPYTTLEWANRTDDLEIDDIYVEDLLLYACYLAYSTRDFDTFNPELANTCAERFRSRVGDPIKPGDLRVDKETAGRRLRVRTNY